MASVYQVYPGLLREAPTALPLDRETREEVLTVWPLGGDMVEGKQVLAGMHALLQPLVLCWQHILATANVHTCTETQQGTHHWLGGWGNMLQRQCCNQQHAPNSCATAQQRTKQHRRAQPLGAIMTCGAHPHAHPILRSSCRPPKRSYSDAATC